VFKAADVFANLYYQAYNQAFTTCFSVELSKILCDGVQTQLEEFLPYLGEASAHRLFEETIQSLRAWFSIMKRNDLCFFCLCHKPEHSISCGHVICENCLQTHGQERFDREDVYEMQQCLLCAKGAVQARIKPRTAGFTILSIDGGGARGIIPLEYLEMLQQGLGDSCQPQDLFDLVAGTSSGQLFPGVSEYSH